MAKNTYQEKILKDKLKKEALQKIDKIRDHILVETPSSYGAGYEENLSIIIEDLDDIILNWKD